MDIEYYGWHRWLLSSQFHHTALATRDLSTQQMTKLIEGGFAPNNGTEGDGKITTVDGWTILAYIDTSPPTGGNVSNFLVPGTETFVNILAEALLIFPWVFARQLFVVTDVG